MPEPPRVSIVIPVLNEAERLDRSLARLYSERAVRAHCEVIVCDGGSDDGSPDIADGYPCILERCQAGRALQMNAAARIARGDLLLFLHVDSSLPEGFIDYLPAQQSWGFFRLRLSGDAIIYRVIESAINLRTRISRVAGGDQGLFFERRFFDSVGGYPPIPLMEDIAISKLARRQASPVIVAASITSSSRRWRERGIIRTILTMWLLRLAYWLGVDPGRLHRIYYPQRG